MQVGVTSQQEIEKAIRDANFSKWREAPVKVAFGRVQ